MTSFTAYECKAHDPPENGALSCREGLAGTDICQVSCKEGYKIPRKKYSDAYLCAKSGKWKGLSKGDAPWPNCGSEYSSLIPEDNRCTWCTVQALYFYILIQSFL